MKRIVAWATFFPISLGLVVSVAWAAPEKKADRACVFSGNLEALKTLREGGDGTISNVRDEVALRRTILAQLISCARAEASALLARISAPSDADSQIKDLKTQFINQVTQGISYYDVQSARVPELGLRGSQDLAHEIRDWRTNNYSPLSEAATNLFMWVANQELFHKAENRFSQVRQTVYSYKVIDNEDVVRMFGDAEVAFHDAKEANQGARDALKKFPLVNDRLSPIKSSLEALAHLYQYFFGLSEIVQKLLPR